MSSATYQLLCFSAIHRKSHLHAGSFLPRPSVLRPKVLAVKNHDGQSTETSSSSESKSTLRYTGDSLKSHSEVPKKPYSNKDNFVDEGEIEEPVKQVTERQRAAKIHDFCFGIPFGGLVVIEGLASFIFSRRPASLVTAVVFGGALLAFSTSSLKVWRHGQSSLTFILGQAVLAGILLWKNLEAYSLTKKIFPTGFFAVICAAMVCFYCYVVASGGNPPKKKLKSPAAAPAS